MDRRRFVAAAVSLATFGIAGCTGGSDEETPTAAPTDAPTDTPTDTPTATADPTPEETPEETPTDEGTPTAEETPTDEPDGPTTVTVAPDGSFRFQPSEVTVAVGETVRWIWDAGGHNVKPDRIPDESDWTGTSGQGTYGAGHEYEHAFEVAGTYEYVCTPHRDFGMTGTVVVE